MPRPKRKSGITDFSAPARCLSANARKDITLAFGIDTNDAKGHHVMDEAFREIEKWVGFYFKATLVSAQLPGVADYKHELSSFERVTSAYLKKLQDYPKWVRDIIDKNGGNLDHAERELTFLANASATAFSTYAKEEGRGRKKDHPRLELIQKLKMIFNKYSIKGQIDLPIPKVKLERKYAEQNFVKTVFKDAGILPVPKNLTRMLRAR